MFTRQHYKAIAGIVCKMTADDFSNEEYGRGWNNATKDFAARLANYFEQDNPGFDRDKFLAACETD